MPTIKSTATVIFASILLVACSEDSGTNSEGGRNTISKVATSYELGACNSNRNGESIFVQQESVTYICANGNWIKLENEKDYASSSSFAQKLAWAYLNPNISYGEFTDLRDNQVYKTVDIASHIWMAENLNFNYNIGSARSVCYNERNPSYALIDSCAIFGRLYTWAAAIDSAGMFSTNAKYCGDGRVCMAASPVQGVCPDGWHLPTLNEWKVLGYIVAEDANKLKSTKGWHISDDYATNYNGSDVYGFSSLPAGIPIYGGTETFGNAGYMTDYWSSDTVQGNSTQGNYAFSTCISIHYNAKIEYGQCARKNAISVRCIKNREEIPHSSSSLPPDNYTFSSSAANYEIMQSSSSIVSMNSSSLYLANAVPNSCNGKISWHGPSKAYRVDTQQDNGSETSGHWFYYTDEANGGGSYIRWPNGFNFNDYDDFTALIDYCGGICGSYTHLWEQPKDGYPYAGIGFNIAGVDKKNAKPTPANVSDWGGICITYVSDTDLTIKAQDHECAFFEATLPKASSPTTKKISWNSFKSDDSPFHDSTLTGDDAAKKLLAIIIEIRGNTGSTGNFNIISIGSYK